MRTRFLTQLLTFALLDVLAHGESLFELAGQRKVQVSASSSTTQVFAGQGFEIRLRVEIEDGWHIYGTENAGIGVKTAVELAEGGGFELAGKVASDPKPKSAPAQSKTIPGYDYHTGKVEFRVPVRAKAALKPGPAKLKGSLIVQECSETVCLQPSELDFRVELLVREGEVPLWGDDSSEARSRTTILRVRRIAPPGAVPGGSAARDIGFLAFIGLAIGAGILTLLTPCVFPLVPVTISYFLKQATDDRRHTFFLSLVYGLGIMASFTALGVGLTVVFSANAVREFAANAWVNLVIAVLFILFGFSLLGAFELQLPAFLTNRLSFMGRKGYGGALFLGLTFAVTAFACTAPFASTIILAAVHGQYFWSAFGMLVYSGTMALPFFILGVFPSLLTGLPRSGGWLNSVKVVFGFFELAAAFKFLANVDWQWDIGFLSRPMVLSLWVVCSAFICLYLLGLFRLPHDAPAEAVSVTRVTFSLVFGALALYLATGLAGKPLPYIDGFLPLAERPVLAAEGAGTLAEHRQWAEDMPFEEGMKTAREQGKPLAVELTAFTCVNCRVMESTVLVDPEVVKEVGRFVSIRLYTDGNPPVRADRNRRFQEAQFGSVALPFYALYDSHGELVRTHQGVAGKAEFLKFLRSAR